MFPRVEESSKVVNDPHGVNVSGEVSNIPGHVGQGRLMAKGFVGVRAWPHAVSSSLGA